MSSPDPSSKIQNARNSKKETKKAEEKKSAQQPLSLLKDLPSLGGPASRQQSQPQSFDEFDDDFNDDAQQKSVMGSGSVAQNKFSKAEQYLKDVQTEEREGFKIGGQNKYQVNVYGIPQANAEISDRNDDEDGGISEEIIEEECNTDRDQNHLMVPEPFAAITVSQSLGVDPSVDSLAIDDYDHVEMVN